MALYLIGLGLWDKKDISVRGLEAVKKCDKLFLESYTSKMGCTIEDLSEYYGKEIIPAPRELVEKESDKILSSAKDGEVALLVMGDPLSATTHQDIIKRAHELDIRVVVIHNASVLNAVGETGLELYKFGKVTSIPFPEKSFRPETPYDVFVSNTEGELHTLFLLDLRPDEDRFMSINQAMAYLLEIADKRKSKLLKKDTPCVGCARLGSPDQLIVYGNAEELVKHDFGKPPHCLIIPSKLHFMEEQVLESFLC